MDFFTRFMSDKHLIEAIRLFSDSCAAQKENHSLPMVLSALPEELGETFELTYPVVGHTFLPADRIFGRLEKIFRAHDTLLTPDDYSPLCSSVAQVCQLNQDWSVQFFKAAMKNILRCRRKFESLTVKRIRVRAGGVIECFGSYMSVLQEHCLAKDRKNACLFRFGKGSRYSSAHQIKGEKLNDSRSCSNNLG